MNIEWLSQNRNFEFIEWNIGHGLPDLKEKKIDYVFSLASPASPKDFASLPLEIMQVNSQGTFNLLQLALEKKARFLQASSSEVYGDPEDHPQKEDYVGHVNPIGPRSCYDESKRFAEAMVMNYHRLYKLETRIARIFNTYGPRMRMDDGRVIPNFIHQAIRGDDLTIYGDGSQTRSFCFVSDLVDALNGVMFGDDPMPVNCGNTEEYTIKKCAQIIIELSESKSKMINLPAMKDDPQRRRPDLSRLKKICSYHPKISFDEGLKKTIMYFRSVLEK